MYHTYILNIQQLEHQVQVLEMVISNLMFKLLQIHKVIGQLSLFYLLFIM